LAEVLLAEKVRIYHLYGLTEAGALMEAWATDFRWVTPLAHAAPFLKFEPVGDDRFHLVVMAGLPAKVYSNREDGSYATKDVFRPHPTEPGIFRFVARLDDIIVLMNGEKADPTPLEDAVSRNANVRAAVVFGAERDSLGMVVVASEAAERLSKQELLDSISADLDVGNSRVPAYARISRDAVIIKEAGTPFPCTDKSTVIKPRFLEAFAADIDEYYQARAQATTDAADVPDVPDDQVASAVRHVVATALNQPLVDDEADFFALGMDSLQASNVRSALVRTINLRGATLATNVVFEHANVALLTRHLLDLRQGLSTQQGSPEALAQALLAKYSHFAPSPPGTVTEGPPCVLLTGATGVVGSHLLYNLIINPTVAQIYCPVRAPDVPTALARIHSALHSARLLSHLNPTAHFPKIVALPCDFAAPNIGLPDSLLAHLSSTLTHIIHNAWSVNFNHALRSFEPQSIRSTYFLLTLAASSLRSPKPTVTFVSSIAAALCAEPANAIPETLHPWSAVAEMGYGQSKWVAEHMVAAAAEAAQVPARVVRLGQICGDTEWGMWNPTEAFPTTVQAARTIGVLPVVDDEHDDDGESWLPVDVAAKALAQVALAPEQSGARFHVLHLVNEARILWNAQFLPYLRKHGLEFEAVQQREWVRRLEASEQDVQLNPPFKLLGFFKTRYGSDQGAWQPKFDTTQAKKWAPCLEGGVEISEELVGKFLRYWTQEAWVKKLEDIL
jgi:thioester reductase-like protein